MTKEQLTDDERSFLVEYHKANIRDAESKIAVLNDAVNVSVQRIRELTIDSLFLESDKIDYSLSWPLVKKTEYVLSKVQELSNTRRIAEMINAQEGNKMSNEVIGELVGSLGATLKQKVDKGVSFNRAYISGEFLYGLVEWFHPDGVVKGEYEPKFKMQIVTNEDSFSGTTATSRWVKINKGLNRKIIIP